MELERIKGIQVGRGGDKISNRDNLNCSQKDLAEELNISQRQLADYKKLTNLIPELQNMIENGSMKATVGYKIWAKMPQEEQEKNDPVKQGRVYEKYERLCGIRQGSAGNSDAQIVGGMTQSQIAKEFLSLKEESRLVKLR